MFDTKCSKSTFCDCLPYSILYMIPSSLGSKIKITILFPINPQNTTGYFDTIKDWDIFNFLVFFFNFDQGCFRVCNIPYIEIFTFQREQEALQIQIFGSMILRVTLAWINLRQDSESWFNIESELSRIFF